MPSSIISSNDDREFRARLHLVSKQHPPDLDHRPVTSALVSAIRQEPNRVVVRYLHDGYQYREATAKYVVVTVPLTHIARMERLDAHGRSLKIRL